MVLEIWLMLSYDSYVYYDLFTPVESKVHIRSWTLRYLASGLPSNMEACQKASWLTKHTTSIKKSKSTASPFLDHHERGLLQLSQLTLRGWIVASIPQAGPGYRFVSKIVKLKVTMLYLSPSIWNILTLTLKDEYLDSSWLAHDGHIDCYLWADV